MTTKVDPPQLKAYAKQLAGNAQAFTALHDYCGRHCEDTAGLTGLLWATAVPAIKAFAEVQHSVLPAAREHLYDTADKLELTAIRYEQSDRAAAERMWTSQPRWRTPERHREGEERSHPGDYRDPAQVAPVAPKVRDDLQKRVEKTLVVIKEIDFWLKKVIHYSLHDQFFPWLTGDWGKVRQIADAYAALGGDAGVKAIDRNLYYGMDSLSVAWDGEAARAFDYHIRQRWTKALATEAQVCKATKEGLESLAQQAEDVFLALEVAVATLLAWVAGRVSGIISAALSGVGLTKVAHLVKELWHHVHEFVHCFELIYKVIPATVRNLVQLSEAMHAAVKADLALLRGDMAAVQGG